jgi:hypothetical protein
VINVHGVHDVRLKDTYTAESLQPEPRVLEVEIAIGKFRTDQISDELTKAGGEALCSDIYKLICSIWNKEKLPQQWKESIIVPIYKRLIKLIVIIMEESSFINCLQNFIEHSSGQFNSICQLNYWGSSVRVRRNRSTMAQMLYIRQILGKKWEYNGTVNQLFIDFKRAYDSNKREVL